MKFTSQNFNRGSFRPDLTGSIAFICILAILFGFSVFVYQLLDWLHSGAWIQYPVVEILSKLHSFKETAFYNWFYKPDSWLGLHLTLQTLFKYPLCISFIGAFVIWIVKGFD